MKSRVQKWRDYRNQLINDPFAHESLINSNTLLKKNIEQMNITFPKLQKHLKTNKSSDDNIFVFNEKPHFQKNSEQQIDDFIADISKLIKSFKKDLRYFKNLDLSSHDLDLFIEKLIKNEEN
ncbi:hypothetical protein NV226_01970 [Mycoplasma iguanae]|uniref:Uncharacterized protein n=1 Tax=Mycoplasma iguanae TaxID=292461 RepID=A0ABY5R8I5_9MOLU|nr:hypothetical protein [Mycoplasma iguanae]UVD81482.1 hypothetical protein NV226_01970 [Mycoplasma iguanae]